MLLSFSLENASGKKSILNGWCCKLGAGLALQKADSEMEVSLQDVYQWMFLAVTPMAGREEKQNWREGIDDLRCRPSDGRHHFSWSGPSELYQVVAGGPGRPSHWVQATLGRGHGLGQNSSLQLRQPQKAAPWPHALMLSAAGKISHPFLKRGLAVAAPTTVLYVYLESKGQWFKQSEVLQLVEMSS